MNTKDIRLARDPDLVVLRDAMARAARCAEDLAIATDTAIHVGVAGKAVRITAEELRAQRRVSANRHD